MYIKTKIIRHLKVSWKKILRITLITVSSLLLLVGLLLFSLRFGFMQQFLKDRVAAYIQDKIKTRVEIKHLDLEFPNSLELDGLFLAGQKVDTLLYAEKFKVDLDMWGLIKNKADLTAIDARGVVANVVRNPDGSFNYDYIVDAFAGNKQEEDKPSKPFVLSLDKINLEKINVSFRDLQSANNMKVAFTRFNTRVQKFDPSQNTYAVGDIVWDGLRLDVQQDLVQEVAKETEKKVDSLKQKAPLQIGLKGLAFTNFNINYRDDNSRTAAKVIFKELSGKVNTLDLPNLRYDLQYTRLLGARIDADLYLPGGDANKSSGSEKSANPAKQPFLSLGRLQLADVQVKYNNTATSPTAQGMDFNHLNFSKLNTEVTNFRMEKGTFAGKIASAEIQEARGLDVQKLTTDFQYGEKEAYLKNLYLKTPGTLLRDEVVLNYNSIQQLTANPGSVQVAADLANSRVAFRDILLFAPQLRRQTPFSAYPNAILNLNTRLRGTMNDLNVGNLEVSGLGDLRLAASGKLLNATNPSALRYDFQFRNVSGSAAALKRLLPPNTLPKNITIPQRFALRGAARGTTKVVNANLFLNSSSGDAHVIAQTNLSRKNAETYNIQGDLRNLNIRQIIQNKDLGIISGKIDAKGVGFNPKTLNGNVKGDISRFDYQGYSYRNVALNATLNHGAYQAKVVSRDANAGLDLFASGNLQENHQSLHVNGTVQKLDLYKLGFYNKPMTLAGKIRADFSNLNPDFLNGTLALENFAISDGKEVYPVQELNLEAVSNAEGNSLSLHSQIADLEMKGKYRLTQIFSSLQHTLNAYYQFQPPSRLPKIQQGQYFTLDAKIKDDDLIRKFVPDLKSFETISLLADYNADTQKLNVDASIPKLVYGENEIENGRLTVNNAENALQYSLLIDKAQTPSLALNKASVTGDIANNLISYRVTTRDAKDVEQFLIAGQAEMVGGNTQIKLNSDGLKLNYENWTVSPDNMLQVGPGGILARNFTLSHGGSSLTANSAGQTPNSPLNVDIRNFQIEDITQMLKKDSLLAKGTIDGQVQLRNLSKNMTFDADVKVNDLELYGNPVGNLTAKATSGSGNRINADVRLGGFDNDVQITGYYNTASSTLDMVAHLNRLQMKSVQGFSLNAIEDAEGYLSGNLNITGTAASPKILGNVKFNNAGLIIAKTGTDLRNLDDEIRFVADGIAFDSFKLKDKDGNPLTVDGKIVTQDYRNFAFNLDVTAKDFHAVDAKEDTEKIMYGVLAIDANLHIRGDLDLPKVDGDLRVDDDTDFTFVLPQKAPSKQDREGIVEFIDQDQIALNETLKSDSLDSQTDVKGLDVNVNITLTKEAKLSILVDKANGDFVKLQGDAQLTGGIDASGKTTLVGVYQVDKGAYEMSVSLLKRRFDIQQGSTITWTGEPTAARLNITAIYKAEAPPIDLLQQQLTSDQLNYYKQRLPFNTELKLGGELLKPQIKFDITLPEQVNVISREVLDNTQTKLAQLRTDEAEMTKQVFALLALGRFVGENPLQSDGGLSASSLVRQSVSQLLSDQMNKLAGDLISGVDLTFDLDSYDDYTAGNKNARTDLNVNLSKTLLNDRLRVTVGSNFGVAGTAREGEQTTNIAGNVMLDYMVSKDGRYRLRAYRKNEYQVALQGQIIETGVGFVMTFSYNEFKDILKRARQNKAVKRAQKAAETQIQKSEVNDAK